MTDSADAEWHADGTRRSAAFSLIL